MKNKNTLKILNKAIELAKLLIELKSKSVPDYKKGCAIVSEGGKKEIVIDKNNVEHYFIKDLKGNKTEIKPPYEFTHTLEKQAKYKNDFHKNMLDAEKELQRVCKETTFIQDIENGPGYCDTNDTMYWKTDCPTCKKESIIFDITENKVECNNCNKKFKIQYILKQHKIKLSVI